MVILDFLFDNFIYIKVILAVLVLVFIMIMLNSLRKNKKKEQKKPPHLRKKREVTVYSKVRNSDKGKTRRRSILGIEKEEVDLLKELDNSSLWVEGDYNDGKTDVGVVNNDGGLLTVLVVDDSAVIRKYISDILISVNMKVILAINGVDALDKAAHESSIDIIITDMEMPKMDGVELVKKIRGGEFKNLEDKPIIVVSAYAEKHFELISDGLIQGFLLKPFKEDDLLYQVNYLINR